MIGRLRGCGQQRDLVRHLEAMPQALRYHGNHAGPQLQGFRRAIGQDGQRGGTGQDMHQLVAVAVTLPRAFAGKAAGEDTDAP